MVVDVDADVRERVGRPTLCGRRQHVRHGEAAAEDEHTECGGGNHARDASPASSRPGGGPAARLELETGHRRSAERDVHARELTGLGRRGERADEESEADELEGEIVGGQLTGEEPVHGPFVGQSLELAIVRAVGHGNWEERPERRSRYTSRSSPPSSAPRAVRQHLLHAAGCGAYFVWPGAVPL